MLKVRIDQNLCIKCGSCINVAPNKFDWDDEGNVKVINNIVDEDVKVAHSICPTAAIIIYEDNENT